MKISIITICYQAAKQLEHTLVSLLSQILPDCEVESVIVDGGSNDGTAETVREFMPRLERAGIRVSFKSERDGGIYDAMNKGVTRAMGEWCMFLNAGDKFFDALSLKTLAASATEGYDIVYGDTVQCYDGKYNLVYPKSEEKLTFCEGMEFCHQSCLIRTELLRENPYTTEYKIASDYDFFVRFFIAGKKFKYQAGKTAVFMLDGASVLQASKLMCEYAEIQHKYGLIDEKTYKKMYKKAEHRLFLRRILPKKLIEIRHNRIMRKETENWTDDKSKIH